MWAEEKKMGDRKEWKGEIEKSDKERRKKWKERHTRVKKEIIPNF